MVGRRGGVGGGDGGGHGVGEHGHELLVVKLIKLIASPRRPGAAPELRQSSGASKKAMESLTDLR